MFVFIDSRLVTKAQKKFFNLVLAKRMLTIKSCDGGYCIAVRISVVAGVVIVYWKKFTGCRLTCLMGVTFRNRRS